MHGERVDPDALRYGKIKNAALEKYIALDAFTGK
jgi:hypothetical protein